MGAKKSEEMRQARALLKAEPDTPMSEIAARVGLTADALKRDPVCREIRPVSTRTTLGLMSKGMRAAITRYRAGGITIKDAAALHGVTRCGLNQALKRLKQQETENGQNG